MKPHRLLIFAGILLAACFTYAQPPDVTAFMAQVARGDYDDAVLALYPLSKENPSDGLVHYWLGRAYYGERHYQLAARALAVTVARDGQNREALLWYARASRASGAVQQAREAYAAYRELHPRDTAILPEYAESCALAGDFRAALDAMSLFASKDTSPETRRLVSEWQSMLDGVSSISKLEPPARYQTAHFLLQFDPEEMRILRHADAIEAARKSVCEEIGLPITDFRVLVFTAWDDYQRYARLWLPDDREITAPAFTLPKLLVLWSPEQWRKSKTNGADLASTLRHEMAHLAISGRTADQGIPLWLNEGLACHYGGSAGIRTGQPPATPLSLRALDQAFIDGSRERQEQAYAQAHAMTTVLLEKLGRDGMLKLLDLLVSGTPLSVAYAQVSGEPFDIYLANWPIRFAALPQGK